ncbi:NrsF family protein [Rhizobium sp. NPDC090279]|uniref:NrsF family protein n=1 Tax=Rhizobium sp. NPDC090279 TaxID=3364499 RepID=UPI003839FA0D
MKTDELITLISQDTHPPVNLSRAILLAIAIGSLFAATAFFLTLGLRPDIGQAIDTVRFPFKILVTFTLFVAATAAVGRVIRPGQELGFRGRLLLVVPALLLLGVALELGITPSALWTAKLIGHNALHCLTIVPALSLLPGIFLLLAMRHGAPERPGVAGALAGLASAGIGATFYGLNCPDDSPLFVATWYPIATTVVAAIGFFAGRRLLRW